MAAQMHPAHASGLVEMRVGPFQSFMITDRRRFRSILLAFLLGRVRILVETRRSDSARGAAFTGDASAIAGRFLSELLFGVSAFDASTYLIVVVALAAAGALAAIIPAQRALSVDPMVVLRVE